MKYPKVEKKQENGGVEPQAQYAALPWRLGEGLEILLVSSRETRRWVIPKGWPMKGRKPHATAALEALQEAGLLGKIDKAEIGSFHYRKRLKDGDAILCRVGVFPLRVARQRKNWPEKSQRATQWFPYDVAAGQVVEKELEELILAFGAAVSKRARA
ncbi:MAG: NUDIX hydrolase [Methylocystaceae bacterium]|nr:MAG: NUDIX hydrolase [Methylocystaceae bacterium]